jgi:DNA repair/transcription protein MET18/MMS19
VVRLLTKIDLVCGIRIQAGNVRTVDTSGSDRQESAAYSHSMMLTLSNVVTAKNEKKDLDVQKYVKELMERIFSLFIFSALQEKGENCVGTHVRLLQSGAQLTTVILQSLSKEWVSRGDL